MDFFLTFILPVLIVLALGALLAFALSFFSGRLRVERNPKIDDVARQLCGANCGACGYAGCDAFAAALVKGEAEVVACKPTSEANKKNIAAILGKSAVGLERTVAVVLCAGGGRCSTKYDYQGYGSCVSAEVLAGGNKACDYGCIGLSSCADNCKYDAVNVDKNEGYARVDDENCISCGACVSACPKKIISRIPASADVYIACMNTRGGKEVSSVCEVGCIACGLCARRCPHKAIDLSNNLAAINYDLCTSCGACVKACPRKCIISKAALKAAQ